MDDALRSLSEDAQQKLRDVDQPDWVDPMLATLTQRRFSDPGWIYERKLDGERCLSFQTGDDVRLLSRNRKALNTQYPEIVDALRQEPDRRCIVDGEVVAFKDGVTSFSRLQDRMHVTDPDRARAMGVAVYYYIFDLLYLDRYDTTQLAVRDRKVLLKGALSFEDPLRYVAHRNARGEAYFSEACRKGWEGIIAKEADSSYVHSRSASWLKFKCVKRQEFVVGGYTDPHGSRVGFGALLLGYYEDGDLVYAGKVGTGFDDATLNRLTDRLASLQRDEPAFDKGDLSSDDAYWVEPELVAQVGFEEWTENGKLRQPRFQGLRQDKDPQEVFREEPEP